MVSKQTRMGIAIYWFLCLGLLLLPRASARAQTVTATVPVVGGPVAVAVDRLTNKIYVAGGFIADNVTVIDGNTNSTTTVPVEKGPTAIAVNPVTN